jgi:SNF2 family DNA or RNA helicase
MRLQQITSGHLPTASGRVVRFADNLKRDALYDLLAEAAGEPVVVFCRFTADLDTVQQVTKSLGLRYGEVSGRRKDALTIMATLAPEIDVAGVQPQSGGVGVDLSAAKIGVWYSVPRPLYMYDQGITRLHRPGTTGVRFFSLIASDTIDEDIVASIADKREIVYGVLDRMQKRRPR